MADAQDHQDGTPKNGVRKTVTFTQKQFGGGLGIGAALLAIQPFTNMFLTNDKAETMRMQIAALHSNQGEIKATINGTKADLEKAITEGNRLILQSIRDGEARTAVTDKRHDRLIERIQLRLDSYEANTNTGARSRNKN